MRPKRQSIIRFWRSSIRDETELKKLDKIKEQIEINKIKSDERTEQYKKDCDRRHVALIMCRNGWLDHKELDTKKTKYNTWRLSESAINWIMLPNGHKKITKDESCRATGR